MKKILLISLTVLIATLFMVSCNMEAKIEDGLAILSFQASDTKSKSLTKTNPTLNPDDFYWYYKAEKMDQTGLKTGQTDHSAVQTTAGTKGLAASVGPFSYGSWSFTLYAYATYADGTPSNLAYSGSATVTVDKSSGNTLEVIVEAQSSATGTLELPIKGGIKISGTNVNADYNQFVETINIKPLDSSTGTAEQTFYDKAADSESSQIRTFSLNSGTYAVTISYSTGGTLSDNNYTGGTVCATETIYVTIADYLTTKIAGSVPEKTGSVALSVSSGVFKAAKQVTFESSQDSVAIAVNAAPTKTKETESGSTAPSTEQTTVTVPKALVSENVTSAKLEVTSYTQAAAQKEMQTYTIQEEQGSGGAKSLVAVGGLDIALYVNNSEEKTSTFAAGQTLEVSTYVATNLNGGKSYPYNSNNSDTTSNDCSIKVAYNGEGEGGKVTSYNATTGELKFTVSHLSSYYFVDPNTKVYNQTQNIAYNSVSAAVSGAAKGDTLLLMDCALSNDSALTEEALSKFNWKVTHNNCASATTHYHATNSNFASGYGTKLEPYKVTTAEQFASMKGMTDKIGYFNIDCSISNSVSASDITSEKIHWTIVHNNCASSATDWHEKNLSFDDGYGTQLEPYEVTTQNQFNVMLSNTSKSAHYLVNVSDGITLNEEQIIDLHSSIIKFENTILTVSDDVTFKNGTITGTATIKVSNGTLTLDNVSATGVTVYGTVTKESDTVRKISATPEVGDILTMGKTPNDFEILEGGTDLGKYQGIDLDWQILDVDSENGRALVISKCILSYETHRPSTVYENYKWSTSSINKWLNDDSDEGFIAKYGLKNVSMVSVDHETEAGKSDAETSNEKVFLLSTTEAEKYFKTDADRVGRKLNETAYSAGDAYGWWLRSPNTNISGIQMFGCAYVTQNGSISAYYCTNSLYIRPAFWLSISTTLD